jgi:uncharacterized membrane protein YphA (DoxX/SURF4 family)
MPNLSRAITLLLRIGLAFVFAYAGFEKWYLGNEFVEQIANYQFHPEWAPWVALLLPPLEVVAASALLLLGLRWRQAGALLMLVMLLAFTFSMERAWSLGINIECGCFGKGSPSIGPLSIARNCGLIAATLAVLWLEHRRVRTHEA